MRAVLFKLNIYCLSSVYFFLLQAEEVALLAYSRLCKGMRNSCILTQIKPLAKLHKEFVFVSHFSTSFAIDGEFRVLFCLSFANGISRVC